MKKLFIASLSLALLPTLAFAQISSADFNAVADYSDDFAAGAPTLNWILDPDAVTAVPTIVAPSFVTATPGTIDADIVADDPLATATGGGAMLVGANSADLGVNFGLNYVIADNSVDGGTGDDLTTLVDYKVTARIWTLGTNEYTTLGNQDRWAVGPYLHAGSGGGDLFRASMFYQIGATGVGPGFYTRGLSATETFTTAGLADGEWRLYTVMVLGDTIGVGYDANGNGTIDEGDTAEFNGNLVRDTADTAAGAPGINCVGEVTNDVYPIFVDTFEVFLPATMSVDAWTLYE